MDHVNGIDVSDYQPDIDWHAVRDSGYSFAIVKATQGTYNTQETFGDNRVNCKLAGLKFGAYHFLDWHQDGVAQAEHFLGVYTPASGDIPPVLDCEACDISPDGAIALIAAFNQRVEQVLNGRRVLLYMSYSFPNDCLNGGSSFAGHPLWVAAYNSDPDAPVPAAWQGQTPGCVMWQWSDAGTVGGVAGSVDLDRFLGDLGDLSAFCLP